MRSKTTHGTQTRRDPFPPPNVSSDSRRNRHRIKQGRALLGKNGYEEK